MLYIHKPGLDLLIFPNKCASSWADHEVVVGEYKIDPAEAVELAKHTAVTIVIRDPVSWYVSGWRWWKHNHPEYHKNFETHLRLCLVWKTCYDNGKYVPNQFDEHTWAAPGLILHKKILPSKIIKLENKKLLYSTTQQYKDKPIDTKIRNASDQVTIKQVSKSKLTPLSIHYIKQLYKDEYFFNQYNLDDSIQRYINTV